MASKIPQDKSSKPNKRKRALLDTNIWRYVIDNEAQGHLPRIARAGSYDVQVAPGVLYETLRLPTSEFHVRSWNLSGRKRRLISLLSQRIFESFCLHKFC